MSDTADERRKTAVLATASTPDIGGLTAVLLGGDGHVSLITPRGGGVFCASRTALTRWVPDPLRETGSLALYIRDLADGTFWSATPVPVPSRAPVAVRCANGIVTFDRVEHGIASRLEICVDARQGAELRRLTLRNESAHPRHLEVTTFAELALNAAAADAAHPAFSKLFVQTQYDAGTAALLAWRRQRSPGERRGFAAHLLLSDEDAAPAYETDRALFLGRGRSHAAPVALTSPGSLSGTTGNVLDPVFALRRTVRLRSGETVTLTAVLAAAHDRDALLRAVHALRADDAVEAAFTAAAVAPSGAVAGLGLPERWLEQIAVVRSGVWDVTRAAAAAAAATGSPAPHQARVMRRRTDPATLLFWNGWGGFDAGGSEYVMLLPLEAGEPRRPPVPWVNVIASEQAGCIVSESGSLYTWSANSRENRLTPWSNDPVCDPHGEALYIRDDETGAFWSPTPGPRPGAGDYEVRHGFGYSQFLHESSGLQQEVRVFVPDVVPARVALIRVGNAADRPRRLTITGYAQLVLGTHEADTRGRVRTWRDADHAALFAANDARGEFSGRVAFAAVVPGGASGHWTTDRREFLGPGGDVAAPAAVTAGVMQHAEGAGQDACFALSRSFVLAPGQTITCAFVLGEAPDEASARDAVHLLGDVAAVERAFEIARTAWQQRLGAVHVTTPAPAIDLMLNGWLAYQNLSCRMWARSAFYQSGGAFGFRDQLQDASALLWLDPAFTRGQILLHAAHQFVEGDVLHWWHPPLSKGIRTRFSDDLLWLPGITAWYVEATGDHALLDEPVPFLIAPPLAPGEDEAFVVPQDAGAAASVYEHCCRALDRSLTTGAHGLPLMGVGDWNDGMNRVGREGRGESVWLGFFLYDILYRFIPLCRARADSHRVEAYTRCRTALGRALNEAGWDGAWYRRAFYDDGTPLGSAQSDECRIDALAQAWAVLSGAAPEDRAARALDALEQHLIDEADGIIRLLTPAFDSTPHDPGYIRGYVPGVRENGGQYTHGVLWAVRALAEHGRAERAARLLAMLSPVARAGTDRDAARYRVEPFVIAADVYGEPPHVGRGGWTWYTGSAGWFCRVALESVLGLEPRGGDTLRIRPCIPRDWPGFRARWRLPDGTAYRVEVERARDTAATQATLDGVAVTVDDGTAVVPLRRDGAEHTVHVRLGAAAARRYVPRLP